MTATAIQTPISARNVSKRFPGQLALDRVSLDVGAGEVHALLGENGSGKSTLIRILSGFYTPEPGAEIFVGGELLTLGSPTASKAAGLRFVHQRLAVIPQFNAVENIALEAGYRRGAMIDWKSQEAYTRELIGRLGIEMDLRRPLGECRPVERSCVAIARALRDDDGAPRAVILDEPTSSLPAPEVDQLFTVIRSLTAEGIGVVYVSHRIEEIYEIGDRVSVLRDGRLQATEEIAGLSRERLIELIVGRSIADRWESPVAGKAPAAGAPGLVVKGLGAGVLEGLDLEVKAGEIVGVAGVAGSGREDLARALVGAGAEATVGSVVVADHEVRPLNPLNASRAGLILAPGNTQPGSATAQFAVRENLTLSSLLRYRSIGRLRTRAERGVARQLVHELGVRPEDPERAYAQLSGGNQQKVILGKALNTEPTVLVMDEPTGGVDVGARHAIYDLIAARAHAGLAVLICSSDLEDIVSVCHRAVVMRGGRAVAEVAGDELDEHRLLDLCLDTFSPTKPNPEERNGI